MPSKNRKVPTKRTRALTPTSSKRGAMVLVGSDYQAVVPEWNPKAEKDPQTVNDHAELLWSPTDDITPDTLQEYINYAKVTHGYTCEQALGMLYWHKHNLTKAIEDLRNFVPDPSPVSEALIKEIMEDDI